MQLLSWLRKQRTDRPRTRRTEAAKPSARFRPRLEDLEGRDVPSTLTVLNNLDDGSAGSLRGEIAVARTGDTIVFAPSLSGQTIYVDYQQLAITKSLNIQGPGAGQLTISGDDPLVPNNIDPRIFEVAANASVTLSGLTISHGGGLSSAYLSVNGSYQGNVWDGHGGGILNFGTLTVSGCTMSGDAAGAHGGGIYNAGKLTVGGTLFSGDSPEAVYGKFTSKGGNTFQ